MSKQEILDKIKDIQENTNYHSNDSVDNSINDLVSIIEDLLERYE